MRSTSGFKCNIKGLPAQSCELVAVSTKFKPSGKDLTEFNSLRHSLRRVVPATNLVKFGKFFVRHLAPLEFTVKLSLFAFVVHELRFACS
jgi:hypothetical protein